jgi:hypothetical protein
MDAMQVGFSVAVGTAGLQYRFIKNLPRLPEVL